MKELDIVYTSCEKIHDKYREEFCKLVDKISLELNDELTQNGIKLIVEHKCNDNKMMPTKSIFFETKAKQLAIDRLISLFKSSFEINMI